METLICTVKHDTFDAEGAFRPRGVQIPDGKVAFGPRVSTKPQRFPCFFRQFKTPREIIRINIYQAADSRPNYWQWFADRICTRARRCLDKYPALPLASTARFDGVTDLP